MRARVDPSATQPLVTYDVELGDAAVVEARVAVVLETGLLVEAAAVLEAGLVLEELAAVDVLETVVVVEALEEIAEAPTA